MEPVRSTVVVIAVGRRVALDGDRDRLACGL